MDERVWHLPGPRRFVETLAAESNRGRQVLAALPRYMLDDLIVADSLAGSVVEALDHAGALPFRIHPDEQGGSIVECIGVATTDGEPPATIPELVTHPDLGGRTGVLCATDLPRELRVEMPDFLRRLESESRTPASARLSLVVVGGRGDAPSFTGQSDSDVAHATVWWWNRVARWDVAAHVAGHLERRGDMGVVELIHAEVIVETARWDLDLAEQLAQTWNGDVDELAACLAWRSDGSLETSARSTLHRLTPTPPEPLRRAWDDADADVWHHSITCGGTELSTTPEEVRRIVWSAQARVLLPWIEQQRDRLHRHLLTRLGRKRFDDLLRRVRSTHERHGGDLVEIGDLHAIVDEAQRHDADLRTCARQLRRARNDLSHLRPMREAAIEELVAAVKRLPG